MKIVLLSGWMKSGKDLVGQILVERGFKRLAFADALKEEVHKLYGIDMHLMHSQEGKSSVWKDGKTVRDVLTHHGMGLRQTDPDVWVNKVMLQLQSSHHDKYVITDWRLPNKHDRLSRTFGRQAVQAVRIDRFDKPPLQDHSETALDSFPFDVRITNRGSLVELRSRVSSVFGTDA
eukprot:jgi/Chrzof1/12579/UNPLg00532.t1